MTKLSRLAVFLALPLGAFAAADPALLQVALMPDTQVLAGLEVTQAKNSLFGQYVLSHLSSNTTQLEQFTSETGFDPRQDVSELVIASNAKPHTAGTHWVIAAHGTFNTVKITAAAQANGGTPTTYQGVKLITQSAKGQQQVTTAFGFLDANTALGGDLASVKAAIDRKQAGGSPDSALAAKALQLSTTHDFWFVTLLPLSNFSSAIPDSNLSTAMNGNLLAGINQASGGVRFGDTVTISAEAVTRSDKDAQSLVDVVKFFAGLVQLNRQDPAAGQMATLLDSLQTSTSGNTTLISLSIPEQQLEHLLNMSQQHRSRRAAVLN